MKQYRSLLVVSAAQFLAADVKKEIDARAEEDKRLPVLFSDFEVKVGSEMLVNVPSGDGTTVTLYDGDWLVNENGLFKKYSTGEFEKAFEEVPVYNPEFNQEVLPAASELQEEDQSVVSHVVTEQTLALNPELADAGVKEGDTVTFSVEPTEEEKADAVKETENQAPKKESKKNAAGK